MPTQRVLLMTTSSGASAEPLRSDPLVPRSLQSVKEDSLKWRKVITDANIWPDRVLPGRAIVPRAACRSSPRSGLFGLMDFRRRTRLEPELPATRGHQGSQPRRRIAERRSPPRGSLPPPRPTGQSRSRLPPAQVRLAQQLGQARALPEALGGRREPAVVHHPCRTQSALRCPGAFAAHAGDLALARSAQAGGAKRATGLRRIPACLRR